MKSLEILHEWPLSKVELVEHNGQKYVLKTIHIDFRQEITRQQLLYEKCQNIKIPRILWSEEKEGTIEFLMEYIPQVEKPSIQDALELIQLFHRETKSLWDEVFSIYDFDQFYRDYLAVRNMLPEVLASRNKQELELMFSPVFTSPYSVVHGDWGLDQLLKNEDLYVIDFGHTVYGPSIMDYASLFATTDQDHVHGSEIITAKIVGCIRTLAWFDLCKNNYIDHPYTKENARILARLRKNLAKWDQL